MDESNLENEIKSLTHEDLCEITLSTLRRLVTSDKLLLDLPPDVTNEEVNAQIAVAQGQNITVTILRNNETPLQVIISQQKSTVYDLKKAIQRCFELKQQRSRSRSKICWKYVWQTYNLRNDDADSADDGVDFFGPVMSEDHRLVSQHGVRNKSKISFVKRLRNIDNRYRGRRKRDRSVERFSRRDRSIERRDRSIERYDRRDRSIERRDRSIERYERRDRSIERRDRSIERYDRRDRSIERRDRSIERRDRSIERYDRRDRSIERRDRSIERRSIERFERRDRSIERFERRDRSIERFERRDRSIERHERSLERPDRSFERFERSIERHAASRIEIPLPEVVKVPEKSYSKADPRLKNLLNQ